MYNYTLAKLVESILTVFNIALPAGGIGTRYDILSLWKSSMLKKLIASCHPIHWIVIRQLYAKHSLVCLISSGLKLWYIRVCIISNATIERLMGAKSISPNENRLIPNLPLQYVTALFFTMLRPLVYTAGNDYCGKT